MSDRTFDPRLARLLRTSTDPAVRPYLPRAIAERAISDASARSRRSASRRAWRIHRPRLLLAAALATGAGAALAASTALAPPVDDARGAIVAVAEPADGSTASVWRVDPTTGRADTLVTGARFVSLAPDARHIAVVDDAGIRSIDTRTGITVPLDPDGVGQTVGPGGDATARGPQDDPFAWSLDGKWVSFIRCAAPEGCVGRIVASDGSSSGWLPLAGPDPVTLANVPSWWWLPDGYLTVYRQTLPHWFLANPDGSNVQQVNTGAVFEHYGDVGGGYAEQQGSDGVFHAGTTEVQFPGQDIMSYEQSSERAWIVISGTWPVVASDTVGQAWVVSPDGSYRPLDLMPSLLEGSMIWDGSRSRVLISGPTAASNGASIRYVVDPSAPEGDDAVRDIGVARLAAWSPTSDRLVVESSGEPGRLEIVRPDGTDRRDLGAAMADLTSLGWMEPISPP